MYLDRYISYVNTKFHRIDKDHAIFGGDVITRDGTTEGLPFIKDGVLKNRFADENFYLKHDRPGCLVMDNRGPHTNASHFFITQKPLPELDNTYIVFGHVVDGLDVLKKLSMFGLVVVYAWGHPSLTVIPPHVSICLSFPVPMISLSVIHSSVSH